MKMWNSRKMCLERFYFEKNHKNANPCAVQLQFFLFSLDTSCLWYSIKYQNWGVPEVICAQRPTTTCMSRHWSRGRLDLSPPPPPHSPANNPINARALIMSPRLSLFSEVSYWNRRGNNKYQRGLEPTVTEVNFQEWEKEFNATTLLLPGFSTLGSTGPTEKLKVGHEWEKRFTIFRCS